MLSLASPLYSSGLPLVSSSSSSSFITRFQCPPQYPILTRFQCPPQYPILTRLPTAYCSIQSRKIAICCNRKPQKWVTSLLTVGVAMALVGPAIAAESPPLLSSIELHEPSNALSLPTWAIHVSSVAEWVIAMALVWQYGDKPGNESWKGLSWGMVPLLGGAMCACTWHFFYNAESLEVLVALQAALTFLGNVTICIAAFRIYKSQRGSENV